MQIEIEKDLDKAIELRKQLVEWAKENRNSYFLDSKMEEIIKLLLMSVEARLQPSIEDAP